MNQSPSYLNRVSGGALTFSLMTIASLLAIGAACLANWESTGPIRIAIESLACSAALVAGVLALVRQQTSRDATLLMVGAGFVLSGWIHLCQLLGLVTALPVSETSAAWYGLTWRFVLAIGFLFGSLACTRHRLLRVVRGRTVGAVGVGVALASAMIFAGIRLPEIHSDFLVHRPGELPAALMFAFALWNFAASRGRLPERLEASLISATALLLLSTLFAAFQPTAAPNAISDLSGVLGVVACWFLIVGLIRVFKQALKDVQRLDAEYKRSVAELARANEGLDAFLRSASHDLKAPLRHIFNFCGFVRADAADRLTAEELSDLQRVTDAATHMSNLLASLLDFAKLGETSIRRERHPLQDIVETVMLQLPSEQRHCVEHGELSAVTGDRALLTIVMQNIIENGLKYSQADPPRVTVRSEASPEGTTVSIVDNGIGIHRDQWTRIFEPGARCVSASEYEGTGYGLATCTRIIHAHGGKIWVESATEKGSTFFFTLPHAIDEQAVA